MKKRTAFEIDIYFSKQDYWRLVRVAPIQEGILIKLKDSAISTLEIYI